MHRTLLHGKHLSSGMLRWFKQSARVKQVGPYCRFNLPAVCHALRKTTMRKKGRGKKGPEKPWTRPDPGERFPKLSLSPCATAQGSPFYLQQAAKEKELLSLESIAAGRHTHAFASVWHCQNLLALWKWELRQWQATWVMTQRQ